MRDIYNRRQLLGGLGVGLVLAGCRPIGAVETDRHDTVPTHALDPVLADIEMSIGGRLGVALLDSDFRTITGHRMDERFAMCSTFKAPLAMAVIASRHDKPGQSASLEELLATTLPISEADLIAWAPTVERALEQGAKTMTIGAMLEAIVQLSDNAATNILLRMIGGPDAMTAFFRTHGDLVTRLDRYEPEMNENAVGDPRDTTSPLAMAKFMTIACYGDMAAKFSAEEHQTLRNLMAGTKTGKNRIRAGLPSDWDIGNKTGTGYATALAVNDKAYIINDKGRYFLTTYVDRPKVDRAEAEAAIANVARHVARLIA